MAENGAPPSVENELRRLVADCRIDPGRTEATFWIRMDGRDWTIVSGPVSVAVADGAPKKPAIVFATDAAIFHRIATRDLHSLTALAQARSTDPTPMTIEFVNGLNFEDAARRIFY